VVPAQRTEVQIRSDANWPATKLQIGKASAGGTHPLARTRRIDIPPSLAVSSEWLRVTEQEISISGYPNSGSDINLYLVVASKSVPFELEAGRFMSKSA
jgi:hypothetical protein